MCNYVFRYLVVSVDSWELCVALLEFFHFIWTTFQVAATAGKKKKRRGMTRHFLVFVFLLFFLVCIAVLGENKKLFSIDLFAMCRSILVVSN